MTLSLHIVLPLVAFFVALYTVMRVVRYRGDPVASSFLVLMAALAVWSLAVGLEHASVGLPAKVFWLKMSYFGILSVPPLWVVLTLRYVRAERWLTRRALVLMSIIPAITLVMVWTNDLHHLMWQDIWLDTSFSPPVDDVTHGAWFWFQAVYSYLLVIFGTLVLAREFARQTGIHRKWVGIMLLGALVPWVANLLYITPVPVFDVLDPTPLAFVITGLVFSLGLVRLRLFNIMPVAHEAVFAHMSDGVVVLDTDGVVVELNPAAEGIIGLHRSEAIGRAYGSVFPALAGRLEFTSEYTDSQFAVSLGHGDATRHFTVSPSSIAGKGQFNGCLLLLHDDTERVRTESAVRERIRLETELLERQRSEQLLRASEAKYRNLVQNAGTGILVSDVHGHVLTANRAALTLFRYATEEAIAAASAEQFFVNADDVKRLLEPIGQTGVARGFEAPMRRRDGSAFWASLNVIVQTTEAGETQYLAIVDDATARKHAERELAASRQNLRLLSRRLEEAREDERTSLARELHDQVGQTFTAIRMDLGRVMRRLGPDAQEAKALLDGITQMVDEGTNDVRRISSELRPGALDDLGLAGAIEFYLEQTGPRAGFDFTFACGGEECGLDASRSTALFRVFQELVTNVVRHSGASKVDVSLGYEGDNCVLTVNDNGCGIKTSVANTSRSLGIVGMRERLLPYDGELYFHGETGKGTTARVTIPLTHE
ncbi:MAG: PAS domain S-box protein [Dehalococcoidia bacterium]|nr:PAS domain S-box protein [Dehalococcoidia bacterium]